MHYWSSNVSMSHRVQTFSRTQLLEEFRSRCQELAADNSRGFKQEFEVCFLLWFTHFWKEIFVVSCVLRMSFALSKGAKWSWQRPLDQGGGHGGQQREEQIPLHTALWVHRPSYLKRLQQLCVCVATCETLTCLLSIFWPRPAADDHCRARLSVQNSNPHSDYINANFVPVRAQCRVVPAAPPVCLSTCLHLLMNVRVCVCVIKGGGSERDFICTQAPMHNTMADFWRMVWEQNVRIIVMVTALRHKDIVREAHLIGVFVCACVGGSVLVLKEPADVWGNVLISFHELDKIFSFQCFSQQWCFALKGPEMCRALRNWQSYCF